MRDDEAFLRAVIEQPDDDLPRLVYADWLDEHGEPERAEFIRVQCELARLPLDGPRAGKLRNREQALLGGNRWRQWAGSLAAFADEFHYRRGFVEGLTLGAAAFLRHTAAILAAAPLSHVRLTDAWEEIDKLAASPHLERIRRLSLWGNHLRDEDVSRLAESPHLAYLEWLDLGWNLIGPAGAEALAQSPHFLSLSFLDLSSNELGAAGARALARSIFFQPLQALSLEATNLGAAGVEALAYQQGLPALIELNLSRNSIGRDGIHALLYGPMARRWRRVILRGVRLTDDQAFELTVRFGENGVVLN
jgi:uncharacterized protein (TIGR02996 family)